MGEGEGTLELNERGLVLQVRDQQEAAAHASCSHQPLNMTCSARRSAFHVAITCGVKWL